MKTRIAALEGAGRRADAHQKSLGRYVKMLENALQNERRKKEPEKKAEILKTEKENHISETKERPREFIDVHSFDFC